MRKASVLLINRVYAPYGGPAGRMLRDLAQAFIREGWDVTVLTMAAESGDAWDGNVRIHKIRQPLIKRGIVGWIWAWTRMLVAGLSLPRHRLVVTMTDPPLLVLAGQMIARVKGSRHMHWCQALYPDLLPVLGVRLPGFFQRFLQRLSRRAMKSCDRIVVTGRCMSRYLGHTGIDLQRTVFIPGWSEAANGYVADKSEQTRLAQIRAAKPIHVDSSPKFRVLCAGSITPAQPLDVVIEAAALLEKTNPEIEFVIVGEGPGHEALAQERSRRGLDNIRLLPRQPATALRELMESGDLHLISLNPDATGLLVPNKLYSALAAQRPCILIGPQASEVGRVIVEHHAGKVVPPGNARALADAILHYRMDGDDWFSAHEGAIRAGETCSGAQPIHAWIRKAQDLIQVAPPPRRRDAA